MRGPSGPFLFFRTFPLLLRLLLLSLLCLHCPLPLLSLCASGLFTRAWPFSARPFSSSVSCCFASSFASSALPPCQAPGSSPQIVRLVCGFFAVGRVLLLGRRRCLCYTTAYSPLWASPSSRLPQSALGVSRSHGLCLCRLPSRWSSVRFPRLPAFSPLSSPFDHVPSFSFVPCALFFSTGAAADRAALARLGSFPSAAAASCRSAHLLILQLPAAIPPSSGRGTFLPLFRPPHAFPGPGALASPWAPSDSHCSGHLFYVLGRFKAGYPSRILPCLDPISCLWCSFVSLLFCGGRRLRSGFSRDASTLSSAGCHVLPYTRSAACAWGASLFLRVYSALMPASSPVSFSVGTAPRYTNCFRFQRSYSSSFVFRCGPGFLYLASGWLWHCSWAPPLYLRFSSRSFLCLCSPRLLLSCRQLCFLALLAATFCLGIRGGGWHHLVSLSRSHSVPLIIVPRNRPLPFCSVQAVPCVLSVSSRSVTQVLPFRTLGSCVASPPWSPGFHDW